MKKEIEELEKLLEEAMARAKKIKYSYYTTDPGNIGTFVAVSPTGTNRIMISNNGTNWTSIEAPLQREWNTVTYSPLLGLWVIGSKDSKFDNDGRRIMTSTDSINWTVRTINKPSGSSVHFEFKRIAWDSKNNLFIGTENVASPGYTAYSSDGISWSFISAGSHPNYIRDRYDTTGNMLGINTGVVWSSGLKQSSNGINWISLNGAYPGPNGDSRANVISESDKWFLLFAGPNNNQRALSFYNKQTSSLGFNPLSSSSDGCATVVAYSPVLDYFSVILNEFGNVPSPGIYRTIYTIDNTTLSFTNHGRDAIIHNWSEMQWCENAFYVISGDKIGKSLDGINWTLYDTPEISSWSDYGFTNIIM